MSGLSSEARLTYPDRVTDRDPDVGYTLREWLEPRPMADDWLAAAFGVSNEPALTGRFTRRAG